MSAKFAGGNVLNADKLVSPTFEVADHKAEIRKRLDYAPHFVWDTLTLRKGKPFPADGYDKNTGRRADLFAGFRSRCEEYEESGEDPYVYTNCDESYRLGAPQEMEVREFANFL